MKPTGTEWTVAALAIIHRRVPDMMRIGGTLLAHALARVKRDIVWRQGAVPRGVPGGSELGGFPAQRAHTKGDVVPRTPSQRAPPAAAALARAGIDGGAPGMVRILMTLPPHGLHAVGRTGVEGQWTVLGWMPLAGEVGASKAEGQLRAYRRGQSGSSLWCKSFLHR